MSPLSWGLENWQSGAGVAVGGANFSVVMPNLAPVDQELFCEYGTTQVRGSSTEVVYDGFRFGGVSFKLPNKAFDGTDLDQVLMSAAPVVSAWSTYPFADTFDRLTNRTHVRAHKIKLYAGLNQTGAVLGTIEMRDGKAVNDSSLSQEFTTNNAVRPFANIGQLLYWGNKRPMAISSFKKIYPSFTVAKRESEGRARFSTNAAIPVARYGATGQQQINGGLQWHHMEQWPQPDVISVASTTDPYDYNAYSNNTPAAPLVYEQVSGWGYEPGSIGGHDHYTGPGGARFDRNFYPEALAIHSQNPAYVRKFRNDAIEDMAWAWSQNYFNHSCHYINDPSALGTPVNTPAIRGFMSYKNAYYGAGPFGANSVNIDLVSIPASSLYPDPPNDGRYYDPVMPQRFWNGFEANNQHLHQFPYLVSLKYASPAHFVANRSTYATSFLARLSDRDYKLPTNNTDGQSYTNGLTRVMAWQLLHHVMAYKTSCDHSLSTNKAEVLAQIKSELSAFWQNYAFLSSTITTSPKDTLLNRLGVIAQIDSDGGNNWRFSMESTQLLFYFNYLFVSMKSTGMWQEVIQDTAAKSALEWIMDKCNKHAVDMVLDTNGRWLTGMPLRAGYSPNQLSIQTFQTKADLLSGALATSWAALSAAIPPVGLESWSTDVAGNQKEWYTGQHLMAQWPKIMIDWYPEYAYPRLAAAKAYYDAAYAARAAIVNDAAVPSKVGLDWVYRYQQHQPIQSPADVGVTLVAGVKVMPTGVNQITSSAPTVSFAAGTTSSSITITVLDVCNNPVAGELLTFTSSDPIVTLVGGSLLTTNALGLVTVSFNSASSAVSNVVFARSTLPSVATSNIVVTATSVATAPTYTGQLSGSVTSGTAASFNLSATGSPASTFTLVGAPAGWSVTGNVLNYSGAALSAGLSTFSIRTSNGVLPNDLDTFSLTVTLPVVVPITITSANTTSGQHGIGATFQHTASGGTGPYTWALVDASGNPLPASSGFIINPITGVETYNGSQI